MAIVTLLSVVFFSMAGSFGLLSATRSRMVVFKIGSCGCCGSRGFHCETNLVKLMPSWKARNPKIIRVTQK